MNCLKIIVKGRVQGVGFRWSTRSFAEKEKLTGTVRNLNDGTVELVVCGDTVQLKTLVEWLESGGPRFSQITEIHKEKIDLVELPVGFEIF